MSKTVHYIGGCAWSDGELYMSDTRQTRNWHEVTCKHCLRRIRIPASKMVRVSKLYDENSFGQLMRDMLNFRTK